MSIPILGNASIGHSAVYVDSIKAMAESVGISNLQDDAAKELSEDITFRLRHILQDVIKFMDKGKRSRLTCEDFDNALKLRNIEPIYGVSCDDPIPFRFVSGGGRELHFIEEKEIDINELLNSPLPKVPFDVSLRSHWLAIEGIQPSIPENPPLMSRDQQRLDSVDPAGKHKNSKTLRTGPFTPTVGKQIKFKTSEQVLIKQLATHELSVEQQLYYKEITEACVGSDEAKRSEALQSLTNDPGLYELLPRLCTFIAEGVRINVVQYMLALLIYLMRMVKALLDNPTLYLERYLHEIIPAVTTCVVSKQLCIRPEADNHWALRDFASKLMATICKNYTTTTNNIQTRITQVFSLALMNDKAPYATLYGAISGFIELGNEPVKHFVLPKIIDIGTRIEFCLEGVGHTQADKIAANKVKQLILKMAVPLLKSLKSSDNLEEYKSEFGNYLGQSLYVAVSQARASEIKGSKTVPSSMMHSPSSQQKSTFVSTQRPQILNSQKFNVVSNSPTTSPPPTSFKTNF